MAALDPTTTGASDVIRQKLQASSHSGSRARIEDTRGGTRGLRKVEKPT